MHVSVSLSLLTMKTAELLSCLCTGEAKVIEAMKTFAELTDQARLVFGSL